MYVFQLFQVDVEIFWLTHIVEIVVGSWSLGKCHFIEVSEFADLPEYIIDTYDRLSSSV